MLATRRSVLALAGAGMAAACGQKGAGALNSEDPTDMALGAANAPVRLIEYASVTCPHCRDFHLAAWPKLKAKYIDTGKVRFVFREYPTNPPELAIVGLEMARCANATPAQYFARLDALYSHQDLLLASYAKGASAGKLLAIANQNGVTREQFAACVADPAGATRIRDIVQAGNRRFQITITPTLILNGQRLAANYLDYEALSALIDSKLKAGV